MSNKAYIARKHAAILGDESRRQYMCYLAAKKRWLAKLEEAVALEAAAAAAKPETEKPDATPFAS